MQIVHVHYAPQTKDMTNTQPRSNSQPKVLNFLSREIQIHLTSTMYFKDIIFYIQTEAR
jgi:hypothetical protein